MEETIVKYETALLANQKGYSYNLGLGYGRIKGAYYTNKGELNGDCTDELKAIVHAVSYNEPQPQHTLIHAPTQSLLQKWLRDKKDIELCVFKNGNGYSFQFGYSDEFKIELPSIFATYHIFKTYDEAMELALIESLNLLDNLF